MLIFGLCLLDNPKWISHIGTLLETDFWSSATYFGFRCLYRSHVGDNLSRQHREGVLSKKEKSTLRFGVGMTCTLNTDLLVLQFLR